MSAKKTHCPQHGPMRQTHSRYGVLWVCDASGCTVRRWGNSTSLPGDQETRDARHRLHTLFDPLWMSATGPFCEGHRPNKKFVRRHRAYRWLSQVMGLEMRDAHFGMFDLEQCRVAEELIRKLVAELKPDVETAGAAVAIEEGSA